MPDRTEVPSLAGGHRSCFGDQHVRKCAVSRLVSVFVACFLGMMLVIPLGGGERNWGYVTLGALIISAVATGIFAVIRRLQR